MYFWQCARSGSWVGSWRQCSPANDRGFILVPLGENRYKNSQVTGSNHRSTNKNLANTACKICCTPTGSSMLANFPSCILYRCNMHGSVATEPSFLHLSRNRSQNVAFCCRNKFQILERKVCRYDQTVDLNGQTQRNIPKVMTCYASVATQNVMETLLSPLLHSMP